MIIGISAETLEDAIAAEKDRANYLGTGPTYPTRTRSRNVEI